jgi:hypothetical protein
MSQQQKVSSIFPWMFYVLCGISIFPFQSESKREEFRRYLESAGVLDAFTKGDKEVVLRFN